MDLGIWMEANFEEVLRHSALFGSSKYQEVFRISSLNHKQQEYNSARVPPPHSVLSLDYCCHLPGDKVSPVVGAD